MCTYEYVFSSWTTDIISMIVERRYMYHWRIIRTCAPPPPTRSKIFHFDAVFCKKNCQIIPIWELAHPPRENPGSATVYDTGYALWVRKYSISIM